MDSDAQPVEAGTGEHRPAKRPSARAKIALTAAGLVAAALLASGAIVRFAQAERARAVERWQARLDLIVATRAEALDDWLGRQAAHVERLAQNPSVALYVTTRAAGGGAAGAEDAAARRAQVGYLRNLLEVSADRLGFTGPALGPAVAANVERAGVAGIALVDLAGGRIAASAAMPALDDRLRQFLARAERGKTAIRDIEIGAGGLPVMAFAAPVFALQGGRGPADQLGWIIGVRPVEQALARLLHQPGETGSSAEAILVRREGATLRYLWPADRDRGPIGRTRPFEMPGLAASWAVETPGGFADRRDYRGTEVLIAARAIDRVPWTVGYKIDREEALGAVEGRESRLLVVAFLALGAVALAFLAVWRHGASLRAASAADRYARLSERFEAQSQFLGLVSDAQPAALLILDEAGVCRFANRVAGEAVGAPPADLVGKPVGAILGAALGERYRAFAREARAGKRPVTVVQHDAALRRATADGDGARVVRTEWIPLEPRIGLGDSVLVVESDITDVVHERERRERMLAQTIDALVGILDRRDPYAAEHSARVARLAGAIADEMRLDPIERDAAVTAAKLMNVGKILVSTDLLTRREALDDHELRMIRDSVLATADLVQDIAFDGPVVETLRQVHARYDGTGEPEGLAGEDILVPARIIAVANAFVAMTSARAWRDGTSIDAALDALMAQSGKAYDRAVLAALATHIENHGGWAVWRESGAEDPAAA